MPVVNSRAAIIKIDSTDFSSSVSSVKITADESDADFVSYEDARAGGARMYKLEMTLKQNTDAAALWYYNWSRAGSTVSYELWPNGGGASATTTTPKFAGTVVVREPDGDLLGGEADPSTTQLQRIEIVWDCTAKPTMTP